MTNAHTFPESLHKFRFPQASKNICKKQSELNFSQAPHIMGKHSLKGTTYHPNAEGFREAVLSLILQPNLCAAFGLPTLGFWGRSEHPRSSDCFLKGNYPTEQNTSSDSHFSSI